MFFVSEKMHGGQGPVRFKWQKKQGNYLATSGLGDFLNCQVWINRFLCASSIRTVYLFDRRGDLKDEISLPGCGHVTFDCNSSDVSFLFRSLCTGLDWDKDGDVLAIIQDKSGKPF